MSGATSGSSAPGRRSLANLAAFIFGLPLGIGILTFIAQLPEGTVVRRYVEHAVEQVEVIMFCCALGALLGKVLGQCHEKRVLRHQLLPCWEGQPVPVTEAGPLRDRLRDLGRGLQNTYLARRVLALLDFVRSRGSANELDDQMRTLADTDAVALESSYSFLKLVIWAIPILGFLGTVLGITQSISGISGSDPDKMSMSSVTGGLSQAFDATALALGLTMILMFVNFLVDRLEQKTLTMVDRYVDEQIAHRFERGGPEGVDWHTLLRQNSQTLLKTTESLVERQAAIWARTMDKAERQWMEAGQRQQERLSAALESALERTVAGHNQRLLELERQSVERSKALFEGLTALATVLRDTGRNHQDVLAKVTERLVAQAETLARIQEGESQLIRLQETLQQNLAALAGTGSFEQAVQSLTAAIHLLTARTGTTTTWPRKAA
jgi:biopolymer transport protein ExbB/TolQ